ncbi:MAG: ABC transporter permease, partial [Acidimicrobiales bacterium]
RDTTDHRARSPSQVRMIANEAGKGLRLVWAYRATLPPLLLGLLVTYLVFQYFVGGGAILEDLVADTAPAMFAYVATYVAVMRMVAGILEERNAGTLEQIHLSPLHPWQLAVGRLAAAMTEAVLAAAVVTAIVLVGWHVDYPASWQALVPFGLLLSGIAGFALLLAAVSFTYPGIGALVHIVDMTILAVNGTIVPTELFPHRLELIAKLAPTTLGIGALRRILVDGDSLADLWGTGALGWLVLHTVLSAAAGWAAYQWQTGRARRDGRLGP